MSPNDKVTGRTKEIYENVGNWLEREVYMPDINSLTLKLAK